MSSADIISEMCMAFAKRGLYPPTAIKVNRETLFELKSLLSPPDYMITASSSSGAEFAIRGIRIELDREAQ